VKEEIHRKSVSAAGKSIEVRIEGDWKSSGENLLFLLLAVMNSMHLFVFVVQRKSENSPPG